jgi:hypothetical protein
MAPGNNVNSFTLTAVQMKDDHVQGKEEQNIYFAYFHTHLKYGLIFWGGDSKSKTIFKLQKRVIRIIIGLSRLSSCRQIFKDLIYFHYLACISLN